MKNVLKKKKKKHFEGMQLVKVRVRIIGTVFPARWNVDTACDELKAFHVTILPRGRSIQTCRAVTSTARPVQVGS